MNICVIFDAVVMKYTQTQCIHGDKTMRDVKHHVT